MTSLNVRARQLAAVERMLRLDTSGVGGVGAAGAAGGSAGDGLSQQWKVLLYDAFGRDVISPLITVGRLRENGVTLHMMLDSAREAIPDVPAVYFVQPTEQNVLQLVSDCQKQLYDTVHLNFSSPVPAAVMELLARRLVEINAVNVVAKVYDQFLGFVSLEPQLFSLNLRHSYARYNNPSLQEAAIETCMDDIARGACAAVATLGALPIVRCPRGGPAEMVARKVCEQLRVLQEAPDGVFRQGSGRGALEQRPMLLIVDRSVDMCAPLMHTSRYQTLVDDLLQCGLNRVTVPADPGASGAGVGAGASARGQGQGQGSSRVFPLDKEADAFWAAQAGAQIPDALKAVNEEITAVQAQEARIKAQTGKDASQYQTGAAGEAADASSLLLSTVESLPALLEKKKFLDRHLAILSATMAQVSRRKVYLFVEPEESMVFSSTVDKAAVLKHAADPGFTFSDKLRFLAIYLLAMKPSQQDADEAENAVVASSTGEAAAGAGAGAGAGNAAAAGVGNAAGAGAPGQSAEERERLLRVLRYVKRVLSLTRIAEERLSPGRPATPPGNIKVGAMMDIARSAILSTAKNAARQVNNFVGESKVMAAVRLMDLACRDAASESQLAEQDAQLMYLDPKVRGEVAPHARIRSAFARGALFVVGGGCVAEYLNLQDYAAGKLVTSTALNSLAKGAVSAPRGPAKQYVYGCSELVNAEEFMNQLSQCA